ncbi:Dipeptide transport system permease protein DppC [compost metagenome]
MLASLLTLKLADMLLLEAALSFLGLGVRLPEPSWGNMMQGGQAYFSSAPWLIAMPGFGIIAVVLAANVLGDRWGAGGRA